LNNPLLLPFDTAPFSTLKEAHFTPAIIDGIATTKKEIAAIVANTASPTFKNTVDALEASGEHLGRVTSVFFNLNSAETTDGIQKIAKEISPLLSAFRNDIALNNALFARVKAVYDQKEDLLLNAEEKTLLEKQYKGFSRNGANLNETDKETLRDFDAQLAKLSLQFGTHVLAETNAYELHITNKAQLAGLPASAVEAAKMMAEEKGKETGWVFTLDYPSYIPFMTYASNRALRKELSLAAGKKGFQNNEYNNEQIVLDIVQARHKRANLLGYQTHAHFVLEERMATSPEKAIAFLTDLLAKATPAAQQEFSELTAYANQKDGIESLQKWDGGYYAEKLKKERFSLDQELLKPYFQLEKVLQGAFTIAEKLYDLRFTEITTVPVYHASVKTYQVTDTDNNEIALFYTDFHPRAGKRNGAWMTSYKSQQIKDAHNDRPHVSIVCNFTQPTKTMPSLLTFNEVTTLFHEFGHALHGMLANTTYSSLSGTSVSWDFVELPSQVLENWCYEEEALLLFAKHYQTDETIPMEYVQKIKASANFHEGMQTLRQLSFGLLDLQWHGQDPSAIKSVKEFETAAFSQTQLYPEVAENCMSTAFSHIFQGGYSAGYYSYKWAEVLDADAFAFFVEKGIFNKEVATRFKKHVLSKGGTEKPMDLYIRFRGQAPAPDALLKRAGLL